MGSVTDAALDFVVTGEGRRIYVDPTDQRARHLQQAHGDFNPGSLRLWRRALGLEPWSVVMDVGSNYGEMFVGARMPSGARLVAFEPNPGIRRYLERTLADLDEPIEIRSEALGRSVGEAEFAIDTEWSGTSSLVEGRDAELDAQEDRWQRIRVPVTTVDEVLGPDSGSFCMKIDVEGFELDVLAGARTTLAGVERWAVMLEILHMSRFDVARLAAEHRMYLIDNASDLLLPVPGGNGDLAGAMIGSGWMYGQDALLVSAAVAARWEGRA